MKYALKIEVEAGEHISVVAAKAVALVKQKRAKEVTFDFNDTHVVVRGEMSVSDVLTEFARQRDAQQAAYLASPEHKERERRREEEGRMKRAKYEVALAAAPATASFSDPAFWASQLARNTDPYGRRILEYAEIWARFMEAALARGGTVADWAEETSHLADTDGITGFMYGAAVAMLSKAWVHGEELRRWHNKSTQIGDEGGRANETGGVLNPALMSVGKAGQ